jgi:hypothetical protein
LTLQIE